MPERIRAAVIGRTGRGDYGHGLDTVWQRVPNVELVAVADDDPAGLARTAERLKVKQAFRDYREMLDKVRPQVVSIGPRWLDAHREMVLAAAERGVHVYLEKPLCRTLAEADEMVAACERTHTQLVVAHQTRYSPRLRVVQELLAQGKIGRVLEFRGRGKEDRRGGGEDLWVLGTHVFDLMRACGARAQSCFARVTQQGQPIAAANVVEGPEGIGLLAGDGVNARYDLADGAQAYFSSHRLAGGNPTRFALQILGTAGIIEIRTGYLPEVKLLLDPSWSPGRSGAKWLNVTSAGVEQPEPLADGGLEAGNVAAAEDLLRAVREQKPPAGNLHEARAVTEMIVAVFASQVAGGPVALPLADRGNPLARLRG